ncbi:extracellular solute-binding protein [Georgenia alba]|uniref:Extracellular solute-binding protein n=1 Tax=Georgenia alba TaxID=2233858 RepID=A0ABW2QC64_9MICO
MSRSSSAFWPMSPVSRRTMLRTSLAVSAAAALTGACSGGDGGGEPGDPGDLSGVEEGAMPDFQAGQQFQATQDLTFTMLFPEWPEVPFRRDWMIWEEIARRTRVSLDCTIVPLSDYVNKRSLLLNAGDAPMLIPLTYPGEETPFAPSNSILPVSDYIDLMPNLRARIQEWNLEPDIDRLRQTDGRYYVLPGLYEVPEPGFSLIYRLDVLDELGLPVPETWDDVRASLEAMKERYPDVAYPFSDMYQGNATLSFAAVTFGARAGWGLGSGAMFDQDSESFIYGPATPQYRELVDFFRGLVADGLMDPESFTQETEVAQRKFATGRSLVTSTDAATVPTFQRQLTDSLGEGNFAVAKIPTPAGPAGPLMGAGRLWHGFVLPASVRENPNFVAMLQFVDWLFYDMATKEFLIWGVEGTTYTKDSSGDRTLSEDITYMGINPSGGQDLEVEYGFGLNIFADGGTEDLIRSRLSEDEVAYQEAMLETREVVPEDPPAPLTAPEQEQATLLSTPLTDTVNTSTLEFILGRQPMSQWDAYVDRLNSNGVDQYLDLMNSAYERFQEENA